MPTKTVSLRANVRGYRRDVFDHFTRADSAVAVGTTDTGQAWAQETGFSGVFGIAANRPWAVSGAGNDAGATISHGNLDGYIVQAQVRVDPVPQLGLIWRSNGILTPSGQKFWASIYSSAGVFRLTVVRQISASEVTLYDQPTVISLVHDQIVTLRVQVIGNLFRFWINDTLQTEITDTNHTANTRAGFIIGSNTWDGIDEFEVLNWGGSPTLSMKAAIRNVVPQTLSMKGAVRNRVTQTSQWKAKITLQKQGKLSLKAAIRSLILAIETAGDLMTVASPTIISHEGAQNFDVQRNAGGSVYIWELDTQFQSNRSNVLSLKANIHGTVTRSVSMKAQITNRVRWQLQMRAKIRPTFVKFLQMRAKVAGRTGPGLSLKARIHAIISRTILMRAHIRRAQFELSMKAAIRLTGAFAPTQQIALKASMTPQQTQRLPMKASVRRTVTTTLGMKARIRPFTDLSMRAQMLAVTIANLEIDYNILNTITARLSASYNAGDSVIKSQFLTMQARINVPIVASLGVTYSVDYTMPGDCQQRPTQRVKEL